MDARAHCVRLIGIFCLLTITPVVGLAQEPTTLWSFLGIPQAYNHVHGAVANRMGKHPGLEKKPPVTGLADKANLESDVPIIKKAAEVKKAEDLKKQKVKAIRYLTEIGCGCYDTDGSVTEALLAASDDCTEEVRLTTVQSIAEAASGACCEHCGQTCCCNKKMLQRLAEMAYERDDSGCFKEPSARVREAAAEALRICCPGTGPLVMEDPSEQPKVAPQRETVEEASGNELDPPPIPPDTDPSASRSPMGNSLSQWVWVSDSSGDFAAQPIGDRAACQGVIVHADTSHRLAHVHLDQPDKQLTVGTRLSVYAKTAGDRQYRGELVVVQAFPGSANVRPSNATRMTHIEPGCIVKLAESQVVRR